MWWQFLLAGVIGGAIVLIAVILFGLWCCLRIDKDDIRENK